MNENDILKEMWRLCPNRVVDKIRYRFRNYCGDKTI